MSFFHPGPNGDLRDGWPSPPKASGSLLPPMCAPKSFAVSAIRTTADGSTAVVALGSESYVWDLATAACERAVVGVWPGQVVGHGEIFGQPVHLTADGRHLLIARRRRVRVWDLQDRRELPPLRGHAGEVCAIDTLAEQGIALTGGADARARLWAYREGRSLAVLKAPGAPFGNEDSGRFVNHVTITRDGRAFITESWSRWLRVFDAATLALKSYLEGACPVVDDWGGDGSIALAARGGGRKQGVADVWRIPRRQVEGFIPGPWRELGGHMPWITCGVLTPDNARAVTAGEDRLVRVWDLERAKCEEELALEESPVSLACTPDLGTLLVGTSGGVVRVYARA